MTLLILAEACCCCSLHFQYHGEQSTLNCDVTSTVAESTMQVLNRFQELVRLAGEAYIDPSNLTRVRICRMFCSMQ